VTGGTAVALGVALSVEAPWLPEAPVVLDAPDKALRNFSFGSGGDLGGDLAMGGGPVGAIGPSAGNVDAGAQGGDFHLPAVGGAPGGDFHLLAASPSLPAVGGALFP
jgi:hypothetical protein